MELTGVRDFVHVCVINFASTSGEKSHIIELQYQYLLASVEDDSTVVLNLPESLLHRETNSLVGAGVLLRERG